MIKDFNPLYLVTLLLVLCVAVTSYNRSDTHPYSYPSTNHAGLVMLGVEPNTYSRQPSSNDINTGVGLTDGLSNYILFESRELNDYGRSFVVRV